MACWPVLGQAVASRMCCKDMRLSVFRGTGPAGQCISACPPYKLEIRPSASLTRATRVSSSRKDSEYS